MPPSTLTGTGTRRIHPAAKLLGDFDHPKDHVEQSFLALGPLLAHSSSWNHWTLYHCSESSHHRLRPSVQ